MEWTKEPLVPVIVTLKVPLGVVASARMERLELPEPVTDVGVNWSKMGCGNPLTEKETVPANPFKAATVTL